MRKTKKSSDKSDNEEGQHLERINEGGSVTNKIEVEKAMLETSLKAKLNLYFQVFRKVDISYFVFINYSLWKFCKR